ncbi:MAG: hypothetical protein HY097_05895, partial [Nitrospinae bacterium]|nr:hypothetical protein [Nitrospinota bacterium]
MQDARCKMQEARGKIYEVFISGFLLLASCFLSVVSAEELPALDLQQLIDEALKNNPELTAARYRASAFKEVPSQMGTLADPKIEIG